MHVHTHQTAERYLCINIDNLTHIHTLLEYTLLFDTIPSLTITLTYFTIKNDLFKVKGTRHCFHKDMCIISVSKTHTLNQHMAAYKTVIQGQSQTLHQCQIFVERNQHTLSNRVSLSGAGLQCSGMKSQTGLFRVHLDSVH